MAAASPVLDQVMWSLTTVGSTMVVAPLFIAAEVLLLGLRAAVRRCSLRSATLGSVLLNASMKLLFQRPRPQLPWAQTPLDYSFPSGHTMNSLVFYLGAGARRPGSSAGRESACWPWRRDRPRGPDRHQPDLSGRALFQRCRRRIPRGPGVAGRSCRPRSTRATGSCAGGDVIAGRQAPPAPAALAADRRLRRASGPARDSWPVGGSATGHEDREGQAVGSTTVTGVRPTTLPSVSTRRVGWVSTRTLRAWARKTRPLALSPRSFWRSASQPARSAGNGARGTDDDDVEAGRRRRGSRRRGSRQSAASGRSWR